jgi:transcription initiation factor IIE alpha subunit
MGHPTKLINVMQEVPRSIEYEKMKFQRTFYLWYIDKQSLYDTIKSEMYSTIIRLKQRLHVSSFSYFNLVETNIKVKLISNDDHCSMKYKKDVMVYL